MIINYDEILNTTGLEFDNETDLIYYIQRHITVLTLHNKNLTNKQYSFICDLENILNAISMGE